MLKRFLDRTAFLGRELIDDFKQLLSPSVCISCEGDLPDDDPIFCASCLKKIREKNPGRGPICPYCGRVVPSDKNCRYCSQNPPMRLYYWGKYDGEMVQFISAFKFKGVLELGARLADEALLQLADTLRENRYDFVIPIPLYKSRHRRREYNQSEIIAGRIADAIGIELIPDSVLRVKATKQQAKIDDDRKRWRNVENAFSLSEGTRIDFEGKRILVVDDIVTTGATVYEASRPIRERRPDLLDVFGIAFAG